MGVEGVEECENELPPDGGGEDLFVHRVRGLMKKPRWDGERCGPA